MSMPFQSKRQIAIGQASIIIFSIAAGFLGRSGALYWLFIILYFILYMIIMTKFGQPKLPNTAKADLISKGKVLFEENKAMEVASTDRQYVVEMQDQLKMLQFTTLFSFLVLIYFFIAIGPVTSLIAPKFSNEKIGYSVSYFILFEGSFLLSIFGQYLSVRNYSRSGKKFVTINMPRTFFVTSEGIVLKGMMSSTGLKFPLTAYKIVLNEERKFVELVNETQKAINKIRLYTKSPNKLYEVISNKNSSADEK
ncbi:DUF2208 domain-containing protein [Fervidicoccus fontis]|uniref:DUF2208 domain-containing protein n=1 Tax=Fervidicoccus fontis TaxID=683846 RepID=A0A7C2VAC7_9CREN|nr:DUF2208 domain-containing protein [Fervidicoccus fontis]PMB77205.1 MAG: hypothetical protein C0177_03995 [Fervidicoccus fontis]HEW63600.1 DUF2208 domain-containing protein [Fervidicoccus fontis]